jgi:hypothetical protein
MTELILRFDTVESANKLLSSMLDLPDVTAVFKHHADTFRNPDKVFEKCDCCGSNAPKSTLVEVDPSVQLRIAELFEDYQIQQIHNIFEGC